MSTNLDGRELDKLELTTLAVCWGLLPWSLEEYKKVQRFHDELEVTPRDSWDLTRPAVLLPDGRFKVCELNMLRPENQVFRFLSVMYAGSLVAAQGYFYRWVAMSSFIVHHEQRLIAEGWLKRPTSGQYLQRASLVIALCQLPFARQYQIMDDRALDPTFSYEEVVARAIALEEVGVDGT